MGEVKGAWQKTGRKEGKKNHFDNIVSLNKIKRVINVIKL